MKLNLSLYVKIVSWFFLCLLTIAVISIGLFKVEFGLSTESPLYGLLNGHIETVAQNLTQKLCAQPVREWPNNLNSFSEQHRVRFHIVSPAGLPLDKSISQTLPDSAISKLQSMVLSQPEFGTRSGAMFKFETSDPERYWMAIGAPIFPDGSQTPISAVIMAESDSSSGHGLFQSPIPMVIFIILFFILSLVLWIPLTRSLVGTIVGMKKATQRLATGNFDIMLDDSRHDELGLLSRSINQMAKRLDGYISGQKRFMGDIAHELASPIARLQLALSIVEQNGDEKTKVRVQRALQEVTNLSNLVNELLSFTRAEFGGQLFKLIAVSVRDAVTTAVDRERKGGAEFIVDIPHHLKASAVPELLVRALSNILRNSIRYAGSSGPIQVRAHSAQNSIIIEVLDTGPGVPEEVVEDLFKPFFRADMSRSRETGGVGLGLAIVETCIQACEGTVRARNREGGGLGITIRLKAS